MGVAFYGCNRSARGDGVGRPGRSVAGRRSVARNPHHARRVSGGRPHSGPRGGALPSRRAADGARPAAGAPGYSAPAGLAAGTPGGDRHPCRRSGAGPASPGHPHPDRGMAAPAVHRDPAARRHWCPCRVRRRGRPGRRTGHRPRPAGPHQQGGERPGGLRPAGPSRRHPTARPAGAGKRGRASGAAGHADGSLRAAPAARPVGGPGAQPGAGGRSAAPGRHGTAAPPRHVPASPHRPGQRVDTCAYGGTSTRRGDAPGPGQAAALVRRTPR